MARKERFDGDLQAFASEALGTERTVFGSTTQSDDINDNINALFRRGWGFVGVNDVPTKQDFNALGYTGTYLSAYLHQVGIAEWNTNQEYFIGNIVNVAGTLYRSLTDENEGNNPLTDTVNWERVTAFKNNFEATTNPDGDEDETEGYSVGSFWINTVDDTVFIAKDVTEGSAEWISFSVQDATESVKGISRFSTVAEGEAGTGNDSAMTPEATAAAIEARTPPPPNPENIGSGLIAEVDPKGSSTVTFEDLPDEPLVFLLQGVRSATNQARVLQISISNDGGNTIRTKQIAAPAHGNWTNSGTGGGVFGFVRVNSRSVFAATSSIDVSTSYYATENVLAASDQTEPPINWIRFSWVSASFRGEGDTGPIKLYRDRGEW